MSPGSSDMDTMITHLVRNVLVGENRGNYDVVQLFMHVLVLSRLMVLQYLNRTMKRQVTPFEYMISQLHPEYVFNGVDIFQSLFHLMILHCDLTQVDTVLFSQLENSVLTFHCFVDEAQILLRKCQNQFLSTDNEAIRSM